LNTRSLSPSIITALWLLPCLAILQAGLVTHLEVAGALANIVLLVVVDWGILRGLDEGVIWAFIGGLLLDIFSGYPLGTSTVALVVVAALISMGETTFMRTHALLPPVTVFLATLLYYAVVVFILVSTHQSVNLATVFRQVAIPAALLNGAANIVVYPLTHRLEQRIYPVPRASW